MKKLLFATALLLAVTGIGFAQATPAAKPAEKTAPAHKSKHHHTEKKDKAEKKEQKQGS